MCLSVLVLIKSIILSGSKNPHVLYLLYAIPFILWIIQFLFSSSTNISEINVLCKCGSLIHTITSSVVFDATILKSGYFVFGYSESRYSTNWNLSI